MEENQVVFFKESIKENQIEKLYEWIQAINTFFKDNIVSKLLLLKDK